MLVGDRASGPTNGIINDAGDVVINWPAWSRDAQGALHIVTALAWKPFAASNFIATAFPSIVPPAAARFTITIDKLGNMALVSSSEAGSAVDIVAVCGTQQAGFGAVEVLTGWTATPHWKAPGAV